MHEGPGLHCVAQPLLLPFCSSVVGLNQVNSRMCWHAPPVVHRSIRPHAGKQFCTAALQLLSFFVPTADDVLCRQAGPICDT
jgi:hypothetical protein